MARAPAAKASVSRTQPRPVQPAFPGEVAGQEREHEEADIGKVQEVGVEEPLTRPDLRVAEQLGKLDRRRRGDRQRDHDNRLAQRAPLRGAVRGRRHHELLPEPLGMLARELARHGVEVAHPLDGHQERLIGGEAVGAERRHYIAQVAFEFLDVGIADRRASSQPTPPLGDLRFERVVVRHHAGSSPHRGDNCPAAGAGNDTFQIPRKVASTTCHCRLCVFRRACPALVMR